MLIVPEIDRSFRSTPEYRELRGAVQSSAPIVEATNLAGSSKAVLATALATDLDVPVLVVAESAARGEVWQADLVSLLGEGAVGYYPQWETLPYEERNPQREIVGQRLEFLAGLLEGKMAVGVTTARALMQKIVAPGELALRLMTVAVGDRVELATLIDRLISMNFERESMVAEVGTFSARGGIVDVFSYRHEHPVRIELIGDEVASIRTFDLGTQRSVDPLERVQILPAREPGGNSDEALGDVKEPPVLGRIVEAVLHPVTEHLHPETVIVVDEPTRVGAVVEGSWSEIVSRYDEARRSRRVSRPASGYLDRHQLERSLEPFRQVEMFSLHVEQRRIEAKPVVRFSTREPEPVRRSIRRLGEMLRIDRASGRVPWILCDNLGQMERLEELLPKDLRDVSLSVGALDGGFVMASAGLAVYTDHEIFDRQRRVRRRRKYGSGNTLDHLTQITPGDYLVHLDYGIGQYEGLRRLRLSEGGEVEALKLAYADGETLYLPVEQIGRVEKFSSEEGKPPVIHRLGSGRWEKQKIRTQEAIAELADELLKLQADRQVSKGFSFSEDSRWQREMESAFLYEDTPDQRAASRTVKRDMERSRPMDRMVCGDVGYGKTEVAVRAAFKAVQDGKQAAVLVPTTVLAIQHLETFGDRLADFPVEVAMLSRFNTPKETRRVLDGVARGTVDIVIGTHRLLSPDVAFAELGLVIIDEEHRFGVRHKERLRAIRKTVDVLTLSATPIPRTMQMSLMGLRDLSIMETPPRDRSPIVTWVTEFDEPLIEEAIRREVDRGGQVFFVHNRVQSIEAARRLVERLVPDHRIGVAHGQMAERELEAVMVKLFHGEIDVLVTTAIIESGLDVPTANTILINRADRFGLAELYQLRGRVGRSHHRAYCYLLTPPRELLTPEAEKRLQVIEEHTDLGAGYQIALHDLELRGAGNLLGKDQSGFIATVGFETYLRLLDETVRERAGVAKKKPPPPDLVYDADAYLPDDYIPDSQQKLALYRRLSRVERVEAVDDFERELEDRFGPLPEPARHLCRVARLRVLGTFASVARIRFRPGERRVELLWREGVEPRLAEIQAAAGDRDVDVSVRKVAPLHLDLSSDTLSELFSALDAGLQAGVPEPIVTT